MQNVFVQTLIIITIRETKPRKSSVNGRYASASDLGLDAPDYKKAHL